MRMRPALALLGPVLGLFWVSEARAEVLVQPDFDAKKFSGLWYVVAMASDCKVFLDKKDHMLMSTQAIEATEEGGLHVHMEFPSAAGCHQVDAEYLKVGSAGHFRVPALGFLDVRITDTDYGSFAVVYIYKELGGALSTMVQLYSRTQDVSPEAMKAFQDFYPTVGLPDNMVVTLPKSDICSPGALATTSKLWVCGFACWGVSCEWVQGVASLSATSSGFCTCGDVISPYSSVIGRCLHGPHRVDPPHNGHVGWTL
ncbi:lipocalin-15 [Orycteropus afer afer]|uniref:Lipocalin-15 n=1 Tax=Orycteropus afer afer TaxID=1230840 RepID=A0A8B7ABA0_ORYAF|nr:lipocalin-15 [Orycteropus afer afer]